MYSIFGGMNHSSTFTSSGKRSTHHEILTSSNPKKKKNTIKIIVVGPASAGKTSLIRRYVLNTWTDVRFSTKGVDFLSKRIPNPLSSSSYVAMENNPSMKEKLENENNNNNNQRKKNYNQNQNQCNKNKQFSDFVTVHLFDTAGQEKYGSILSPSFYKGANGALLIYDATSRKSFQNCVRWYHILRQKLDHCLEGSKSIHQLPIVVIANKLDLLYREVSKPMRVVPQRRIFGDHFNYSKKYYGPGLKKASVEDLARAAGGMEAAMRAADINVHNTSSYGHSLSSFLEPASALSIVVDPTSSSFNNTYEESSSATQKSAWRVQNSTYNESYLSSNHDVLLATAEDSDDKDKRKIKKDCYDYLDSICEETTDEDLLPDREFILMWCRQYGLGHLETSALDGTGVATAINAVVSLALSSLSENTRISNIESNTTLTQSYLLSASHRQQRRYHKKINLQDRYRDTIDNKCICTSGCS